MPWIIITEPTSKLCSRELSSSIFTFPRVRGSPGSAARGKEREREREREREKRKRKGRQTDKQSTRNHKKKTHQQIKKERQRRERTSAHRADGGDNARTDTPKREEPATHPSAISKHAPKAAEEREDREERRGYKATPSTSTAARTTEGLRKCVPNHSE